MKTTEKKEVHHCSHLASASTKPNLQSYRKKKTKSTHTQKHTVLLAKKRKRERESSPCLDATSPGFKRNTMQA